MPRTSSLPVRTPEGIVFTLPLAGPVARLLAGSVDLACVFAASSLIGTGVGLLATVSADVARAFGIVSYFAISVGYGMVAEWFWRGQTLGKRLLGLRVLDAEGLRLAPSQIVLRNLLRPIDALPAFYLVGGLAILSSRRSQRLGDLAGNTIVVRQRRAEEPDLELLRPGKFNSLRRFPHLCARLRQRVTPAAASLAVEAVLRRDDLEPGARVALFSEFAAAFRKLVDFPPEVAEETADEQYVRNVLDVVYRK